MKEIAENIQRFESLINSINRPGKEDLLNFIRKSDFYEAPASTRFHLACSGGLLQHSLNVYDCLCAKKENPIWRDILGKYDEENLIIMALLHDVCKIRLYVKGSKNQKTYEAAKVRAAERWQVKHDQGGDFIWETVDSYTIEEKYPLGHGEKSVICIQQYMRLEPDEIFAIRWHMGFAEAESMYLALGKAMEQYPIVLALHEADLEASKILEAKEE